MGEVDKTDINRIHDRMDDQAKVLAELNTNVAVLANTLAAYTRPCPEHVALRERVDEHLAELKGLQKTTRDKLIGVAFDIGKMALVALVVLWISTLKTPDKDGAAKRPHYTPERTTER